MVEMSLINIRLTESKMTELQMFEQAKICLGKDDYENAIALLESCIEDNPEALTYYWNLGLVYLLQGEEEAAQGIWLSIFLQGNLEQVEKWTTELISFMEVKVRENLTSNKLENAKIIYEAIFAINPDYKNPELLNNLVEFLSHLATNLSDDEHQEASLEVYLEILNLNPSHVKSWYSLAVSYYQLGWYNEAEESILKAIEMDNLSEKNYHLLNVIREKTKNDCISIKDYQQSIENDPQSIDTYYRLGNIYLRQKEVDKAIEIYKMALEVASFSDKVSIFYKLGNIYKSIEKKALAEFYLGHFSYYKKQYQAAISYFEEFLASQMGDIDTYVMMVHSYISINQPLSAIILIEKAFEFFPDSLLLKRLNQVVLPIIYKNTEEIKFYRQRFCQLLNELIKETKLNTSKEKQVAINNIQVITNFYLGYQGENDLEIQKQYGNYLYQVVSQIYPQWCQLVNLDQNSNDKRIRVGYISSRLDGLGILYLGWLKYCDKSKFEIYIYDISGSAENIKKNNLQLREDLRKYSHNFKFVSGTIDNICATLVSDKLDILIFTELGLDPKMTLLSCLRLAPIQCTTWGQPMTSGSPNIDYFLSSNLMEPDNGEEHYSETLIRLPNVGFAFEIPVLSPSSKQGFDFQFRDGNIIYLCCQALFKYLPQYDYIFPSIVQQNKLAQFVFMDSYLGPIITNSFRKRIDKSFAKFDLNYEDYCVFLRQVKFDDFLRLNQLADIFLDSFGWSGGITTKDAIACSLPIVTCPGAMMRARQSYGMLRMIGVTETIAETEAEYIEIAVRLGLDHEWRQTIRDKMTANKHRLFDDQECVKGLESFFKEVVQKHKTF